MARVIRKDLEAKLQALNGKEWDSVSEDDMSGGDDEGMSDIEIVNAEDLVPPPLPVRAQKGNKRKKGEKGHGGGSVVPVGPKDQPSGVIYIGHIPHGFYEEAMNGFFGQFGDVVRVRLSRSKKSGRCKGYAYVEFASPEVAGIVASTMNGYFLVDKQLVCKVLKFGEIHPNLFDGAGHTFRKVNWHGLYRQKYNADRTPAEDEKHTAKLLAREKAKRKKLAALGIDYDFPGFIASLEGRSVAEGPFQPKPKYALKKEEAMRSKKNVTKSPSSPSTRAGEASTSPRTADGEVVASSPASNTSKKAAAKASALESKVSGEATTPARLSGKKGAKTPPSSKASSVTHAPAKGKVQPPSSAEGLGEKAPKAAKSDTETATPSASTASPVETPSTTTGRSKPKGSGKNTPKTPPVETPITPASSKSKTSSEAKTPPEGRKNARKRAAEHGEAEEGDGAGNGGSTGKKPKRAKRARA